MRTIYCFRTFPHNILILNYRDDCVEITRKYIDYTTKQAIRLFRQECHLVGKHIQIIKGD